MTNKLTKKQEDALQNEIFDIEWEIMDKVDILVSCKWDSETIRNEVDQLCKQRKQIEKELYS